MLKDSQCQWKHWNKTSNDYEYHERLAAIGTPVLVLDHHELDRDISENTVLINNQTSPLYENKELTGVGVTWQFCRAYDETYDFNFADQFIDLAAWGICGDMGSVVTQENQAIMQIGFHSVQNPFFWAILRKQAYSITGDALATDEEIMDSLSPIAIAFYAVPLINAMIRVGTMEEKERMFLAFIDGHTLVESHKRGAHGALEEVAIESARECGLARTHQNKYCDDAMLKAELELRKNGGLDHKILILQLDDSYKLPSEVNGLLATKLAAQFKLPTMVVRQNNEGFLRGSIRNVNNGPLESFKDFLTESGYCEYVQGHASAAGCSFPEQNFEQLLSYADEKLADFNFGENSYDVNFVRSAADADLSDIAYDLDKYKHTYGQANEEPKVYIHDLNITERDWVVMGRNKDTLKIQKFGITYIMFFASDVIDELRLYPNAKVNIVAKPNLNEFGGRVTVQYIIDGIEILDDTLGF